MALPNTLGDVTVIYVYLLYEDTKTDSVTILDNPQTNVDEIMQDARQVAQQNSYPIGREQLFTPGL